MTLSRRIAPWIACSALFVQGCTHQPPAHVRYGLKTYPTSQQPEEFRRPSKDRAPLATLNPDDLDDAVPGPVTLAKYGNHTPYDVLGKRYYLMPSAQGYAETGTGSWYGEKFQGQPTSTMEPYDLYAMTAAHKTLPLPTFVKVTNLENNRSVVVKVNDRGPFVDDRIIDLSYAAAVKLGYAQKGTARVKVEAIIVDDAPVISRGETRKPFSKAPGSSIAANKPTAPQRLTEAKPSRVSTPAAQVKNELLLANAEPTAAGTLVAPSQAEPAEAPAMQMALANKHLVNKQMALADKQIFLQAGAFSDQRAAHSLQNQLTQVVKAPVKIAKNDDTHFRVHVGPFADETAARAALAQIRDSQLANPLLIRR